MPANLREHRSGQFLRFHAGMVVGQYFSRQAADRRARMLRRVMLRERRASQLLFQVRRTGTREHDSGQMRNAVRRFS